MTTIRLFSSFVRGSARLIAEGPRAYWAWLAVLAVLIASGLHAYYRQVEVGLAVTAMRDQVSWGFYIGNFTFLLGVAAAAVVIFYIKRETSLILTSNIFSNYYQ